MAWQDLVMNALQGAAGVIAALVIAVIAVGGWFYYKNQVMRYKQFNCIIWQKDGFGQINEKYDHAGIFVDKDTKTKRFFMKKANVGLNPDNVPYIPTGRGKKVYLLQCGLKNFKFIRPNIGDQYINFTVGEEDVNWGINSYEKSKARWGQSWLMQYMPFIILAFVCMVILILFIYLFKQFSTIKDLIVEIQTLARLVAAAKSGTTVV